MKKGRLPIFVPLRLWLGLLLAVIAGCGDDDSSVPVPTATATATARATDTSAPTASPTSSATVTRTVTLTSSFTPTPTASATRTFTTQHGPTHTSTVKPTPTPTFRHGQPTPSATPSTPEPTPSETPTPEDSRTPTPTIEGAPALHALIAGSEVQLSWDPLPSGREARILRRLNAAPTGPDDVDSDLIFTGSGTTAVDAVTELLPDVAHIAGQPSPHEYVYALYSCEPEGGCDENGLIAALRPTLAQVLVAGGYVLHWRHSAATVCADNTDLGTAATTSTPNWWRSCEADCNAATARQLNDTGRIEATSIGDALRRLDIPIGRVLSSEYCRNIGTAELMNFGPEIETRQEITYFVYDEAHRCQNAYALIGEVPTEGTNTAIIGHAGFSGVCAVLGELAWSEAAIFKPDGSGGAVLVARVPVEGWREFP